MLACFSMGQKKKKVLPRGSVTYLAMAMARAGSKSHKTLAELIGDQERQPGRRKEPARDRQTDRQTDVRYSPKHQARERERERDRERRNEMASLFS